MSDLTPVVHTDATVIRRPMLDEQAIICGHFTADCFDPNGQLLWHDEFPNVVCTAGKNVALDAFLAGSGYTVTGPFMGLISDDSYTGVSATDTMSSHAGWREAGATYLPQYTAPRKTCAWSSAAAGAKALSAALSFAITGAGTCKGAFLVYFTGAVSTIDNTSGTLFSAGLFTGGDRAVGIGDTLNVSYSVSM